VRDDELFDVALGILHLQHRQRVALFVRRDDFERFISCLVFVPRDRYATQLRLTIQSILERAFAGTVVAQYTQLGDAPLARLHIVVQTAPGRIPSFDIDELEAEIVAAARSWSDHLLDALEAAHGEEEGRRLHLRYRDAFPLGYRERFNAEQAIADIQAIEAALADSRLGMALYRPFAATDMQFRVKVYQKGQPIVLSHALPLLEHLGLRVVDEVPHAVRVHADRQRTVMIHDFGLETQAGVSITLSEVAERFREAFLAVWEGRVESDRLNSLVTLAGLTVDQVRILRAYNKYLRQAGIPFTQAYLERVLSAHPSIAGALVRLFLTLFDPDLGEEREQRADDVRTGIAAALDQVASAEDDRILRRFFNLVDATLRTNYFQATTNGAPKPYLVLKLDSRSVDDLPLPRPMVELFVYSPRTEGIHLRGGKVARGGLRWSDRREDFRTEVLGLMKAQTVKNAVIVPVGAKGGFVVKRVIDPSNREAWQAEGIECYRTLVRGLLDVTDNLAGDRVLPPPRVVRRDGDDPYLVVAADKGTATFSDIANGVAAEYDFWLGDAFASGGSHGYDHKAIGITARGAWEGIKRHFREMGRDIQREDFTVVGVGDMSGDVFGNGMLLSPHIKLLAAFDHRHIFVDPDPDPAVSFAERRRVFDLPQSSWQSYDRAKMSPGGEIFDRQAKMLVLTPQIRGRLGIDAERLSPSQLIRELLCAEVDLLWFGGIGTFVKSTDESHTDVGDRANDPVRVDARALRCQVIGEGANLGVTQLGRIEFARWGGRINTDFIDNSAGVDCSDHEVNIKILIDSVVAEGDLTTKQRNQLLVAMTDEVADLVLRDNYLQTQAISLMQVDGFAGLDRQARLTRLLERQGRLNRAIEFLPDEEALTERAARREGLTRPELAVLFSYCKIWVNDEVLHSDLPDDAHLAQDLVHYFPSALRDRFRTSIARHKLKRELIASSMVNSLINRMGGTFVVDMAEKAGMPFVDIARAYIVARHVFDARAIWRDIEALDGIVAAAVQYALHRDVQQLIERGTLWFLRNGGTPLDISANIAAYEKPIAALAERLGEVLAPQIKQRVDGEAALMQKQGVPAALAERIASLAVLPSACDIVRIAAARGLAVESVARLYFSIGQQFGFGWLRERAGKLSADGYWQRLAVSAVIEELYAHQRDVTLRVLSDTAAVADGAFEAWCRSRQPVLDRSRALLTELEAAKEVDFSMLAVASRQLGALTES
jgi:glutamate dehydrogenase